MTEYVPMGRFVKVLEADFKEWLITEYIPSPHEQFLNAYLRWSRDTVAKEIAKMQEAWLPFVKDKSDV